MKSQQKIIFVLGMIVALAALATVAAASSSPRR